MIKTDIYKRDSFKNPNIPYLFNKDIIEYDMKSAGFSLVREFKLLPVKTIQKLELMKNQQQKVEIGKLQRDDENFKKALAQSFEDARQLFFDVNDIDINEVLSIKKDAIFLNRRCKNTKLGDFIEFRPKNEYTSYIQLSNKLEFYYAPHQIEVKGISDEELEKHEEFMIKFICNFFRKMETSSDEEVIEFTKRFIDKYKRRKLEVGYYREFDFKSKFRTLYGELFNEYWEENKDELDISYNFQNILIKLIQIPL